MSYLQYRQNLKLNGKEPQPKKVYKINFRSKKREKQQKEYVAIVKEMLAENPMCELKVVGVCQGKASGLHHQKKRIGFLTDKRYLKRACDRCNEFCETHPKAALELGLSLSKF